MLSPNELTRILQDLDDAHRQGLQAALATVVLVTGSAYRRPGARMLVRDDGRITGGVSGGCLERDVTWKACAAMRAGRPSVVHYDTTDEEDGGFGAGLGCRGEVDILIEPVWLERTAFHVACLREMLTARVPHVLATCFRASGPDLGMFAAVSPGGTRAIYAGDHAVDPPGFDERVTAVLHHGRWQTMNTVGDEAPGLLLEYLPPVPRLLVVGGGPDSEPLAACAQAIGYEVTVADDRPGYLTGRQFPQGTRTTKAPIAHLAQTAVDTHTACVVATHNVAYDARALACLLPSQARYIGILGPRRRTERLLEHLGTTTGPSVTNGERLYAPTGLDIGADTPEQIALAVLAEIQAVMTGRSGGFLRNRAAPIHDDVPQHVDVAGLHA